MRRLFFITVLATLALASCKKDKSNCSTITDVAPATEIAALKQYIDTNHIDAVADSRGFYYKITTAGTNPKPTVCSTIQFNYNGMFLSGTSFDHGTGVIYPLSQLIIGWQEGIPLVGTGGVIRLYIPPSLAYGPNDYNGIPGGSILIFDITLNSFQ